MIYYGVIILMLLVGLLSSYFKMAQSFAHNVCQSDGTAVGGFDLVSYRQEGGPVFGSTKFVIDYKGLTYRFANESNLLRFRENPEKFLPEYDGVCAVALAHGRVICPDYGNFKIENDRLLLFEVSGFTNGRTLWNSKPGEFRKKADSYFMQLNN